MKSAALLLLCFCLLFAEKQAHAYFSSPCATPDSKGCSLIGTSCSVVGKTTLDNDQANLIACLCDQFEKCDSNNHLNDLKWVAMSSNLMVCQNGFVLTGIVNGHPQCASINTPTVSCAPGQNITSIVNGNPICSN